MSTTKPQLGTKYACYKCGTKFYDLGKKPALCPKCKADQKDAPPDDPKKMKERFAARDAEAEAEEKAADLVDRETEDDDLPAFGDDVVLGEEEDDDERDDEDE